MLDKYLLPMDCKSLACVDENGFVKCFLDSAGIAIMPGNPFHYTNEEIALKDLYWSMVSEPSKLQQFCKMDCKHIKEGECINNGNEITQR